MSKAQIEISEAAKRALVEAEERRKTLAKEAKKTATEKNGRGGLDPARYGDWEKNGIAVDF